MKAIVTALISHFVCSKGLGTTRELVSESLMAWKAASSYNKPAFGTKLIVESEGNGSKISSFLIPWFGTKNRAAQALKREILVNDRRVYQNYLLKEGDTVEFNLRSQSPYDSRGAEIEIETVDTKHIDRVYEFSKILLDDRQNVNPLLILYDDDDCAVVFKPSGVHSLAWTGTLKKNSLALDDVLPAILQPPSSTSASYNSSLQRPLPCHRLDARVSGCILVGKTIPSLASLNKQFQNHSILKEYCAIVCGNATAELDGKTTIDLNVNGLPAITHVRIDEVVGCNVYGSMSKLTLIPVSGRRHQLRQHCASIGCPIVGDDMYHNCSSYPRGINRNSMIKRAEGNEHVYARDEFPSVRQRGGLFLMSTSIEFEHPVSKQRKKVSCKVSEKFGNIMMRAKKGAEWSESQNLERE